MATDPNQSFALPQKTFKHLLMETCQYLTQHDLEKIQRAYDLANQAHMGMFRRSGEPYIQHPLAVALLLAVDMRIDADGIVAALLHDVVEDTNYTLEDVREQFGTIVAKIVDGVTKFDELAEQPAIRNSEVDAHHPEEATPLSADAIRDFKRRQPAETVRKMQTEAWPP